MAMRPKLAIIASHPIRHFCPVYRILAESGRVRPIVFYCSDHGVEQSYDRDFGEKFAWNIDLLGGYEHLFLEPALPLANAGFWRTDSRKLRAALDRHNPDAVMLYGYGERFQWRGWRWAKRNRKRILYWGYALDSRSYYI